MANQLLCYCFTIDKDIEYDKEPLRWGWKIVNSNYTPIITYIEAGLSELLRIVHCGCKGLCGAKFSCRKPGLQCSSTYNECHGLTCSNTSVSEPEADQNDYQRCFLDAFELY